MPPCFRSDGGRAAVPADETEGEREHSGAAEEEEHRSSSSSSSSHKTCSDSKDRICNLSQQRPPVACSVNHRLMLTLKQPGCRWSTSNVFTSVCVKCPVLYSEDRCLAFQLNTVFCVLLELYCIVLLLCCCCCVVLLLCCCCVSVLAVRLCNTESLMEELMKQTSGQFSALFSLY